MPERGRIPALGQRVEVWRKVAVGTVIADTQNEDGGLALDADDGDWWRLHPTTDRYVDCLETPDG